MGHHDLQATRPRYLRALLVGTGVTVLVNWLEIYSSYSLHSSRLNFGYLPMCTLIPFVGLILIVNPMLRAFNARWGFRPDELLIIFVMALIAAIFPGLGLGSFLIGIIAAPYYYASPENHWAEYLQPYIPSWIAPTDTDSVRALFEGLRPGEHVAIDAWFAPALWWFMFIAALFTASLCGLVMLRKQWVVRERLAYPLAEMPLELIRSSDEGAWFPSFVRDRLFWMGFTVPMFIVLWNAVTYFYPEFPAIPIMRGYPRLQIARAFPPLFTRVNFFVMSFAFLTSLDVLFSIWFFHLLTIAQIGVYNRIGYTIGGADVWCGYNAATGWQSFGAFTFMVLWGLWMARDHLRDVWKKALNAAHPVDDSDELIPYRPAVVGFVLASAFMMVWLHAAGMEFKAILLFLFGLMVLYLGITKIVAQCGLVYFRGPMTIQSATMHILGTATLAPSTMTALALSFGICCDAKTSVATMLGHICKLSGSFKTSKRALLEALVLALTIGMIASFLMTLGLSHELGAYNFGAYELQRGNLHIMNSVVSKMITPVEMTWQKTMFVSIGAVLMAAMTFLRYRFLWWPLHPVGFTTGFIWPIRATAFSIFLAWFAKLVILKLGGIRGYQRARAFFLGTLIGYVSGITVSLLIDVIWFPGQGHGLHHW